MFQGFSLTKQDDYMRVTFESSSYFCAAGALAKIGSSLKPNHNTQVNLVNGAVVKIGSSLKPTHNTQVNLVKIPDTHCSKIWKKVTLKLSYKVNLALIILHQLDISIFSPRSFWMIFTFRSNLSFVGLGLSEILRIL